MAILVAETTLLPVYIELAPSATLAQRIPAQVGAVLTELPCSPLYPTHGSPDRAVRAVFDQ